MEGLANYHKEERPWGGFEQFTLNQESTVKILTVNASEEFSLQSHGHRDEFWRVIGGSGTLSLNNAEREVKEGDTAYSPRGTMHRAKGGPQGLKILEIAFGEFDENDIKRLEDRYGRV